MWCQPDNCDRVAKAFADHARELSWDDADDEAREEYREEARLVIAAMREPTDGMLRATWANVDGDAKSDWYAMIDAALKES